MASIVFRWNEDKGNCDLISGKWRLGSVYELTPFNSGRQGFRVIHSFLNKQELKEYATKQEAQESLEKQIKDWFSDLEIQG